MVIRALPYESFVGVRWGGARLTPYGEPRRNVAAGSMTFRARFVLRPFFGKTRVVDAQSRGDG